MKKTILIVSSILLPLLLVAIDYLFVAPGSLCPGELYAGVVDHTVTYGPESCRSFWDYFNHTQETGSMIFHWLVKMYGVVFVVTYMVLGVRGMMTRPKT